MVEKLKTLKVNSFNSRGLRNNLKRQSVFEWIKKSHNGITLIQESHSAFGDDSKWQKEWEGKIIFSHGEHNARGVAILIPKNIEDKLTLLNTYTDNEGRLLLIKCKIENNKYTIINVYVPTKDNPKGQNHFLQKLVDIIDEYSDENIIIGGDFNTYLNPSLDKKGGLVEKLSLYAENLICVCKEYSLIDIYRIRNPTKKTFTRRENSRNGYIHSRLDYLFLSVGLSYLISSTETHPGNRSDHSLISFTI